jgi:hypothetical protein
MTFILSSALLFLWTVYRQAYEHGIMSSCHFSSQFKSVSFGVWLSGSDNGCPLPDLLMTVESPPD